MGSLYGALGAFCAAGQPWLLDTIRALVALESPTGEKAAVDRCGVELARRLEAVRGRVTRLPQATAGDHLRAEWGTGERQVLLLGHFDTVWPLGTLAAMPCRVEDGRLYGPGTFDMKTGIALGMLAVRALHEAPARAAPRGRIVMLWTTDEETGSATSRAIIEDEARRSAAVLVLEPGLPGGALKTQRKGCGEFRIEITGQAAHAGVDPGKGVSAIRELARQVIDLERLQDVERGVTVNVGTIEGGSRANVVAEHAAALVDVRVPTAADARRVDAAMRALAPHVPGARLTVSGGIDRPPLERTPAVVMLYERARAIAAELGHVLPEGSTGGGSDGNFTAAAGLPTLDGLGAVGDGAHARHEHVVIAELPWRAAVIAGLVSDILEVSGDSLLPRAVE